MTGMGGDRPQVRARDVDREFTIGLLRDASVDGQLTTAEFEERSAAARQARTLVDLVALTADLQNAPLADQRLMPATMGTVPAALMASAQPPVRRQASSPAAALLKFMAFLLVLSALITVVGGTVRVFMP
jgi:hypothetical protein